MADETNAVGSSEGEGTRSEGAFDDALDESGGTSDVLTGSDTGSGDAEDLDLTNEGDNDTGEINPVGSEAAGSDA